MTIVPHKTCTRCGQSKPVSEYHKRAASPDGLRPICKTCVREYQQERKSDPDVAEYRRKYEKQRQQTEHRRLQQNASARKRYVRTDNVAARQAQTDANRRAREESRQARLADPAYQEDQRRKKRARKSTPKALAQRRKRRAERYQDPEYRSQVLADQRRRSSRYEHLYERARQKHTERYNSDPEYRKAYNAKVNVNNHKRNAILSDAGSHTPEEWLELCEKYDHRCLCCGKKKRLTKDHVLPLSKGGKNTIDNLQPLCMKCNLKKHARHIDYRPVE